MFRITELARQFGLSRSTLLYYDRIGLLKPTGRSEAGYRMYSAADRERLQAICGFRSAGLAIGDIQRVLEREENSEVSVLQKRMRELGEEIGVLRSQQRMIAQMLKVQATQETPVDKEAWIEMLRAAGMDEAAMFRWHAEFERRAPEAHQQFLVGLGIGADEVREIRRRSAEAAEKR
ncbi:MerR family transcriptional regulator [Geomonas sp. Red875]|uniref:MerR family transcriptional regulator n=2 Tax=Geomesophilobacter sediminis TaxID=2798584 RepID=A0A8J7IN39_9BACT|nr:MerR family transcriptional regulator [Geomesophilobacter sediminis]